MKAKCVAALLAFSTAWSPAPAQTFPSKPIRIIVPSIAGSSPDVRVRQIAPRLSEAVGQPVIVDNRPGANGAIAAQQAAKAAADGHTLFFALINNAVNDLLNPNSCCRLNHELVPVAQFTVTPLAMVVHPSVAASSLKEFVQLAKSKPGALTYSSGGPGSATQLLGEWIKSASGISVLEVPYKSVGAEIPDLLSGQVTAGYLVPNAIAPHVRAGKLRALAVAGPARVPVFPDVPTMAEAGLPGVEASVWNGYFVPSGTPQPIIQVLNRELLRTFSAPDVREQVAATGGEIVGGRPEEFAAFIRSEIAKWSKVIADAGIKLQ